MVGRKRMPLIMEAVKYFDYVKIEWHIIGDGPDKSTLEIMAEGLPPSVNCIFYGACDEQKINEIYKTPIDCFINASTNEGLPVSIMEAVSAGIPIVATDVGGTKEIVNEQTGVLVPSNINPQELAKAVDDNLSKFKNPDFRVGVAEFWKKNFNSKKNYASFYKRITEEY